MTKALRLNRRLWLSLAGAASLGVMGVVGFQALADTKPVLISPSKGSTKAPVTLIEYGSVTCSHCANWHKTGLPTVEKKYIRTGQVRYVFREVATAPAPIAFGVYLVGHCAANKKTIFGTGGEKAYFTVIDGFFASYDKVMESGDAQPTLTALAKKAGLSTAEYDACLKNDALLESISNRMQNRMEADDVKGTPTFFVNGKRVSGHALKDVEAAIVAAQKAR
ncbi:MAG: thioredoxin domain-containing protein [Asticcacaulis sp.]